jgi:hypothetical protein
VGATGAQGTVATGYGYVFHDGGSMTQIVGPGGSVLFDSNGVLSAVTHAPGSSAIVVENAGTYLVDWNAGMADSQLHFCLAVNTVTVAGSCLFNATYAAPTTLGLVVALAAGDSLSLVNPTTYSIYLRGSYSLTYPVAKASLRVIRLQ